MPQSLLRCVRSRSLPPAQCEAGDAARCVAVDPLGERAGGASSLSDHTRRSLAALALATRLDPKVQGRLSPEVEAPLLRRFEEQVCAAAPE